MTGRMLVWAQDGTGNRRGGDEQFMGAGWGE